MAWTQPYTPNLTDYQSFLVAQGFNNTVLPADSDEIQWSLNRALSVVMTSMQQSGQAPEYTIAVYNCAAHHLVMMAQDVAGLAFFSDLRARRNALGFVPGVTGASGDQGTSTTLVVPEQFKGLRFADLEYIKTVWGINYLSYAQKYGPSVWVLI